MLYIKVKYVGHGDDGPLVRVSRFRTNESMQRVYEFGTEAAAAILTKGHATDSGKRCIMGHTLPAQEMAEATEPFTMDVEREDGVVVHLRVEPTGRTS